MNNPSVPLIDFSILGGLHDDFRKAQKQGRRDEVFRNPVYRPDGTVDVESMGSRLAAAGAIEEAMPFINLADTRALREWQRTKDVRDHEFRVKDSERQQQNWQAGHNLQIAQFNRGEVPQGFENDPTNPGAIRPRRGGPADPTYIQSVNEVKEKPRVLNAGEINKLSEDGGKFTNILGFTKTFENRFAGRIPGTGDAQMTMGRYLPGWSHKDNVDGAAWWQGYDRYKNQVRNDLFGSALTATEQAAFEKADINPSMDPEQIKKNIKIQQDIVQGAMKRKAGALLAGGYDPRQIAAAYGLAPRDLNEIIGVDPALARNPNFRQYLQPQSNTQQQQQQQQSNNLPRIGSRQEMMRLAPGTKFIWTDGSEWTVPPR